MQEILGGDEVGALKTSDANHPFPVHARPTLRPSHSRSLAGDSALGLNLK